MKSFVCALCSICENDKNYFKIILREYFLKTRRIYWNLNGRPSLFELFVISIFQVHISSFQPKYHSKCKNTNTTGFFPIHRIRKIREKNVQSTKTIRWRGDRFGKKTRKSAKFTVQYGPATSGTVKISRNPLKFFHEITYISTWYG